MSELGRVMPWGRMAVRATRATLLRRLGAFFLDAATRVLDTVRRDAGRARIGRDVMFAAVRVYLRFTLSSYPMAARVLVAEAIVSAARSGEAHAAAEAARMRRLTGALAFLNVVAVLPFRVAARTVALARAAARFVRACAAILAHALTQRGSLPSGRSTAGRAAF
ncbi:hypothetical protein [Kitasatospora sp. MBT66]|uniref:hypothetical protein n=1 Tax=Kitasatospora sp. MBT66 TaxID=1444769 RepID=UPI0005BA995A|nr:hypothetical protein [Kitasatospora sp. MBT66]